MMSREEMRRQQKQTAAPVKKPHPHHFWASFLGVLLTLIIAVGLLLNATVLNADFAADELADSPISTQLKEQVNSSLSEYGVSGSLLTTKETKRLVKQAVKQVYAGKNIKFDLTNIEKRLQSKVDDELGAYGLSTSMLPDSATSQFNSQLTNQVNQKLNTSEVQTAAKTITTIKTVVNVMLIISGIALAVLMVWSLFTHCFLQIFSWSTTWTAALYFGLVWLIKLGIAQAAQTEPDYASTIVKIGNDVLIKGWQMAWLLLILALVWWLWRGILRIIRHH
ncbi:hypothetical protein PO250_04105 [Limosilactobacillus mucosae]|uniref:Uncharacterized protein n=2 Tax=Limosilactobacillus mucosae TaxID=97478 RepID=A0AAJ1HT46_LIMMU|nr:hypothetical protein [Limosilactobacillus mucosae]MDC2829503.1 hypothetical protein [Limosilactobacillus mucosae]MDC2853098.1 hypothetical protein [Limosilactobacillus mucosae]